MKRRPVSAIAFGGAGFAAKPWAIPRRGRSAFGVPRTARVTSTGDENMDQQHEPLIESLDPRLVARPARAMKVEPGDEEAADFAARVATDESPVLQPREMARRRRHRRSIIWGISSGPLHGSRSGRASSADSASAMTRSG